jgi:beta-lactamase class A
VPIGAVCASRVRGRADLPAGRNAPARNPARGKVAAAQQQVDIRVQTSPSTAVRNMIRTTALLLCAAAIPACAPSATPHAAPAVSASPATAPAVWPTPATAVPATSASPMGATAAATATTVPHPDPVLQATLDGLVAGFGGDVGVYVRHLGTGATAQIRADDVFPTASMIKVPILMTLLDQVERGVLDLDARVPYPDTLRYAYVEASDVVGYMSPGDTLPLGELAFLMMTISDNVASLWIQALVGGGVVVNKWLEAHGFVHTRVNSRTPGRDVARSEFGWGQTTPREIARALVMIREGRAVSPRASERMYRLLTKSFWDGEALSEIPPTVQAASKQGFVSRSRSEVLLVNAPGGDYVLSVITKNQADTSDAADNEGFRLIRAVSRAVYRYFEPTDQWWPADGGADPSPGMR